VPNQQRISGLEAAKRLLYDNGLSHVRIEGARGELTDHYDPRSKTLRLSGGVARSSSVAALGIVAHEVGHAVQDATAYTPLKLRSGLVPMVNIGSWLGPILFMVGLLFNSPNLAWVGVAAFAGGLVFALITLPVEYNASRRAVQMLQTSGLVSQVELKGARSVLSAASLTYVAAVAQALSTLLYYIFLLTGSRRRD
jgi:Zn-dependent membrane protease YugP